MDETNVFLTPLLSCDTRDKKFQLLLNACNEQCAFTGQAVNEDRTVVVAINSRLNKLLLRPAGIQLLKIFLTQCQDKVFVEQCVFWMTQCIKGAVNPQMEELSYEVLRMLINKSHNFKQLRSPIAGLVIPVLSEQLVGTRKSIAALQCLQEILHHYPKTCRDKLDSIKRFLLAFLDEEDNLLVEHAARCMCYFPPLLTSDTNEDSQWTVELTELCATANTLLYELFETVHEVIVPSGLTELSVGYKLSMNTDSTAITYHITATRIINILKFVEGMLLGDLHHVKAVRADILVALAYRILAVNCKMVSRVHSMENISLASVLPGIHVAAFNMLQTLVSCCPGGLLKYGPLFCKLVLQTLKWTTKSSEYGVERPYRRLREAAYIFLQNWMLRASAASCVEHFAEELVSLMLNDVFLKKETVTLQFQEKGTKKSSKPSLPEGQRKLADPKANAELCEASLLALCTLVQTSGSLLKTSLHMNLQEITVSILLDIRRASGPEDHLFPFYVTGCRMQLYRLLLVLMLHPHPQWPPPTQFALSLFAWGQHDSALEVAGFCNLAVAFTRQIVHPSRSSHQFSLSVDSIRSSDGLPELNPVQDLQKNVQRKESSIETVEIEADTNLTTSNTIKSLNNSLKTPTSSDIAKAISPSSNSGKSKRKKSQVSTSEMVMNGVELSPHFSDSSKAKKKKLNSSDFEALSSGKENTANSEKANKKTSNLLFTVEELNVGTNKKRSRKSVEDWKVTDLTKKMKKMYKENKDLSKSVEVPEVPIEKNRSIDDITVPLVKVKAGKQKKTPKSDVEETPKSWVVHELCQLSREKMSSEICENNFPKSNEMSSSKSSEKLSSEISENSFSKLSEKSPSKSNNKFSGSEKSFPESNEKSSPKPSKTLSSECSQKTFPKPNEKSPYKLCENLSYESSEKLIPESNEKSPSKSSKKFSFDSNLKSFPKSNEELSFKSSEKSSDSEKSFHKSNEKLPFKSSENISSESNDINSPSKSAEKISPKSSKGESLSNLHKTVSLQVSEEKDSKNINDTTIKESNDVVDLVGEKQSNSVKIISIVELDVDDENHALEQDGKHEIKIISQGGNEINEKDASETLKEKKKEQVKMKEADNESVPEKEPVVAKFESSRYNLRSDRINSPVKVGNNDSGALKNDCGKEKFDTTSSSEEKCAPKASSPVVEFTISSDSESGEQQKEKSEVCRRITRSLTKLSSTPLRGSEQCIDIEELPSSQDNVNTKVLNSILEEESTAAQEPNVVLAESDESANLVLRIDSDRESVEIDDITNEFKKRSKAAENDKGEITISKNKALNKPNDLKNTKDSVTSDREMEEFSTGMEAVENSPDVAVEDVASCDKETAVKKSSSNVEEEDSDSGSADEDILKTFVDVVSPKSE